MCIYIDRELTREFKRENKEFVIAYKVLNKENATLLSPLYRHQWQVGENKADKEESLLSKIGRFLWLKEDLTSNGIYVYLKEPNAEVMRLLTDNNSIIVPVKCFTKDLIAVGLAWVRQQIQVAVFNKVFLAQEDYDNAYKEKEHPYVEAFKNVCCN